MVRKFAPYMLTALAVAAAGGFAVRAQAPVQNPTVPGQNNSPSPLPDGPVPNAPVPRVAPLPEQAPQDAQPESSVSSSAPAQPRFWTNPDSNAQVTVLENTLFRVMTNEPMSTRQTREGAPLLFMLSEDVVVDGVLILPRGATVHGTVVESKQAGTLTGSPDLVLKLTSLDLGKRSYPLYTYQLKVTGASKTKPTENKIKGGAVIGAVVGGIFSGSANGETTGASKLAGIGTGAALGAGIGTAVSAATPKPILTIPAESQMDFYLSSPISVVPVSEKEASRLSEGLRPGGPVLYVRGERHSRANIVAGGVEMAIEVVGVAPLIQVFHMPTAIRFYRDMLGFTVTGNSKALSADPDDVNWAMLELGGAEVMLNTAYDPDDVPEKPDAARWDGHQDTCLYLGCPDVDGAYRELAAKGLKLEPPKVTWYGMKQLYFKDPDGFGICFQWKAD